MNMMHAHITDVPSANLQSYNVEVFLVNITVQAQRQVGSEGFQLCLIRQQVGHLHRVFLMQAFQPLAPKGMADDYVATCTKPQHTRVRHMASQVLFGTPSADSAGTILICASSLPS